MVTQASSSYTDAYNVDDTNVNNLNTQISLYNNGVPDDQNAVDTLNNAISTYNSGLPYADQPSQDAAYAILQAATNDYNSYATSRNETINQTNQSINIFNLSTIDINAQVSTASTQLSTDISSSLTTQSNYTANATLLPIFSTPQHPCLATRQLLFLPVQIP